MRIEVSVFLLHLPKEIGIKLTQTTRQHGNARLLQLTSSVIAIKLLHMHSNLVSYMFKRVSVSL